MGRVIIVGAGPGDPELITVKGLRALRTADCVLYDRLVARELLKEVKDGAKLVYVGKEPGNRGPAQREINEMLLKCATQYESVVRLHGGDPFIFGRGFEECAYLVERGVECEIVPGVTSGLAAPAKYLIPPVLRGKASSVALVTGKEDPTKGRRFVDFKALARAVDTIIIYMGASNADRIAGELLAGGIPSDMPVAVITRAYMEGEKFTVLRLSELRAVESPSIIVVGNVVEEGMRLRELLRKYVGS